MISSGHIERASESKPSDYENCSSAVTVWGLTLDICQRNPILRMQYAITDFAKNVDSLLHTMAIESDG